MMFKNSKNFIGDNTIEGFDELARETVSNDNDYQDDVSRRFLSDNNHLSRLIRSQLQNHPIFERHGMSNMFYEGKTSHTITLHRMLFL